jgi:hypothetical protein
MTAVRRGVLVGFATMIASFVACSSFDEAETTPAPAVEAGVDGPVLDAPPNDSDAPPPPFCKTDAGTFCADFDDPGATPFVGNTTIHDGGAIELVDASAVSPPNALRMSLLRPPPDAGCTYVVLQSAELGVQITTGLGAQFEMKLDAPPAAGQLGLGLSIRLEEPTSEVGCSIYLSVDEDNAFLVFEGTSYVTTPLMRRPLPGEWSRVELDFHAGASGRAVSVAIGGASAGPEIPLPSVCQNKPLLRRVQLGLYCVQNAVGIDVGVSFDDIRVIAR